MCTRDIKKKGRRAQTQQLIQNNEHTHTHLILLFLFTSLLCLIAIPLEEAGVAQLAALLLLEDNKEHADKQTDAGNNNVACAQKRVAAAHPGERCQNNLLLAGELRDGVLVLDLEAVEAVGQRLALDLAVELAEVGQGRSAHPHDKVLVLIANTAAAVRRRPGNLWIGAGDADLVDGDRPAARLNSARKAWVREVWVPELGVAVGRPGDAVATKRDLVGGAVARNALEHLNRVVEEAVCDKAAGSKGKTGVVCAQRVAVGAAADVEAVKLRIPARLDIATVVLVVVLEGVVDVHIVVVETFVKRHIEVADADGSCGRVDKLVVRRGDQVSARVGGARLRAVRVVDDDLLDAV
eukprot:m.77750 g.77750  ORF g.77750 m.77750 type:complete len:352 (-) comp14719_c0_seq2:240-1295(-)